MRRYSRDSRSGSFKSRSAYRRFLRKTGLTEADLLVRAELGLMQLRLLVECGGIGEAGDRRGGEAVYARHHAAQYEDKPRAKALRATRRGS